MESELDGHGLFSIYYGELVTFHFYFSFKKKFFSFGGGNFILGAIFWWVALTSPKIVINLPRT